MKKYMLIPASLFVLASCTKDISRFNEQTKKPEVVPAEPLFSNAVRNLSDGLVSSSVNTNVFRFTVQHWAATTYQDEPQYDFTTRAIPQSWWARMYRDVLKDLDEAKKIAAADMTIPDAQRANKVAITDIMQVYTFTVLVNTFGNVPYTEALNSENVFPVYDDASEIYKDLFARLDADLAAIDPSAAAFSETADFLYKGDVDQWVKFANSLKIRMALTMADVTGDLGATAKAAFEAADAKAFSSSLDNALFPYMATTPNTNPLWTDLVQSGRKDMVACEALLDILKDMNDPRLSLYFRPNNEGKYVGGILGSNNTYSTTSKPSEQMIEPDFPGDMLDYVEVEFFRAEAAERGWAVDGTAATHYNNAVKASIRYWGGSEADANAYLARPDVAYATAAGDWKQKIGFQKWIALYNRGFEGWTEVRRLDQPVLNPPVGAVSGFPNRFTYPGNEQQLNGTNYRSAADAIGGDEVETKLFWDKN
ncbi:SusD/RagB family nutrient-binding outer membrane lipoprotein [Flavihumibacter petaseus]|uniref:SusD/RagB family nutrient-binding outer membrane lipoprotein n=1 Tax=Flavihumibacter petaseus NBRC 106054 TaxID=1220578 RepID=A0A0E9N7C3_9BACT|nr:SusD/RagB family nutrient-binding outer membrane lipoprotein [Flavihumibacter petaseus]GAO45601.1 hypothetical protein FPE01S_06_00920 [Flavihumibacter petaseus NBRC 106054]